MTNRQRALVSVTLGWFTAQILAFFIGGWEEYILHGGEKAITGLAWTWASVVGVVELWGWSKKN